MLINHLIQVPGCEWVGAIPLPPLSAWTGMSWGDISSYYYSPPSPSSGASTRFRVMASPYGASRSLLDTLHSVEFLWTSDQLNTEPLRDNTQTMLPADRNPQSLQASSRRHTSQTARLRESAG